MSDTQDDVVEERSDSPAAVPQSTERESDDGDGEPKSSKWKGSQVLFGLVLAGLAGVYFMHLKTGPKTATAAAPDAVAAKTTINTFLTTGGTNVKLMEKMLRSTEKVVQQFLAYPSVTQVPLTDLKTNPFRASTANPKSTDDVDEVAARKRKDEQRQSVLKAVQNLQLQSVLVSEKNRSCMINNALYLEGQQVDQFVIERVAPGAVVVRNGVYRFELKMQH